MPTIHMGYNLTPAEHDCPANSWADLASRSVAEGWPVSIEGVEWQSACKAHGFYGAIQKVKAAHRLRKQRNA